MTSKTHGLAARLAAMVGGAMSVTGQGFQRMLDGIIRSQGNAGGIPNPLVIVGEGRPHFCRRPYVDRKGRKVPGDLRQFPYVMERRVWEGWASKGRRNRASCWPKASIPGGMRRSMIRIARGEPYRTRDGSPSRFKPTEAAIQECRRDLKAAGVRWA